MYVLVSCCRDNHSVSAQGKHRPVAAAHTDMSDKFLLLTLFLSSFLRASQVGSRERNTTNPTTETQTAAATNRPAATGIYWVLIESTGRLCLTVVTVILMSPSTSCPAGRRRFLEFRIHTPSPGGHRTRRRTSGPPGAGSGFHLCGWFGTGGGRGPDRGLCQRGEPGGHSRLGAGQSSAHGLT